MASLAPPWRCSTAVRRLGLNASRPRRHLLRVRADLVTGAQSGAWAPLLPQAAPSVGLTSSSWPSSHRACSSNAGPSPPNEQASSASGAIGAIVVQNDHIARHVPGTGLLIQAGPLQASKLSRGSLVTFKEEPWLCLFEIDRYWFAVPADGRHRDTVAACLQRPTPTQSERAQLHLGFSTGVAAVDVLAPLGRGQSMLICGPRASGKSSLAREILAEALALSCFTDAIRYSSDLSVEPVANPSAQRQLRDIVSETKQSGDPSLMHEVATLYAAVAEAEAVRDAGGHAILVLDTIAPLVEAWELALQLVEAVVAEADEAGSRILNKDSLAAQRRNFFAGLSERAANLSRGGSLTLIAVGETADAAVPGVHPASEDVATVYTLEDFAGRPEAELDRLRRVVDRGIKLTEATVATMGIRQPKGREPAGAAPRRRSARPGEAEPSLVRELQSLSDGQIVLSSNAAAAGLHPAVIVGATLSRFGLGQAREEARAARAGTKATRRDVRPPALQAVAAHLRTELALDEDQHFNPAMASASTSSSSSGTGANESKSVDEAKSAQLHAVKAALLQQPGMRLPFEETTALLLAACSGALDGLPQEQMEASLRGGAGAPLLQHLREAAPKVLEKIRTEPRVSEQTARELDVSVRLFAALRKAK